MRIAPHAAAVAVAALSCITVACGNSSSSSDEPSVPSPASAPSGDETAYRLAAIDGAATNPSDDAPIAPYRAALSALDGRCTESTADQIGDYAVNSQQLIGERRGVEPSLLEVLQTAADPGFDVSPDCARVFTAVVVDLAP